MLTPTNLQMPEATYTPSPWFKRFWLALLLLQSALLISVAVAILRHTPDTYPNQHARLATNGAAMWFIALSSLLDRPRFKNAALAAAFVLLAGYFVMFR